MVNIENKADSESSIFQLPQDSFWTKLFFLLVTLLLLIVPAIYLMSKVGLWSRTPTMRLEPDSSYEETLHVVADKDYPPYSYTSRDGKCIGHDIELIYALGRRLKKTIKLELLPWDEALDRLSDGKADLILGKEITHLEQNEEMTVSETIVQEQVVFWGRKSLAGVGDLRGKHVGVIAGGVYKKELATISECEIIEGKDYVELLKSCVRGECDYVLCQRCVGQCIRETNRLVLHQSLPFSTMYLGIGALKKNSALINDVNTAIQKLNEEGTLRELRRRWLDSCGNKVTMKDALVRHRDMFIVFLALWTGWGLLVIFLFTLRKIKLKGVHIEQMLKEQSMRDQLLLALLTRDFDSVFAVNMVTDEIFTINITDQYVSEVKRLETEKNFYRRIADGVKANIYASDKEYVLQMFSKENIQEMLAKQDSFSFSYRVNIHGVPRYTTARISRADQFQGESFFIVGIRNSQSEIEEQLARQMQEHRKAKIIEQLSEYYDYLSYVDFVRNEMTNFFVSESFNAELFGSVPDEPTHLAFDRLMRAIILPEDFAGFREATEREKAMAQLQKEGFFSTDFRVKLGNKIAWYRLKMAMDKEFEGGVILGIYSIDEEKKAAQRLSDAYEKAESASQSKSDFLFKMSHDIRTPLNAITGYAAISKKHIDEPEKVSAYLDKISTSTGKLLPLVNQVLNVSRIESGKVMLAEELVDVVSLGQTIIESVKHAADQKHILLESHVDGIKHSKVYSDSEQLNQILSFVISTIIRFAQKDGNVVCSIMEIHGGQDDSSLYVFSVMDTGQGRKEAYFKDIFKLFTMNTVSDSKQYEGAELGVSIVRKLIELMGGSINIEAVPEHGTKVVITIPLRWADEAAQLPEPAKTVSMDTFRGKRVLLVDDNDMNREIATEILEEQGVMVEVAEDGDVAVAKMKELIDRQEYDYYDVILMDVQMSVMSGYEATQAIRRICAPFGKYIPIIAMTANAFEEDRQNALKAGMDEHLTKPINVRKLWETLAKFM